MLYNNTLRSHSEHVYDAVLNNRSPESPSPGTIMPSSESCQRQAKVSVGGASFGQQKKTPRPGRTHHIVDAAGIDLESRVCLGDASQTRLGTENREDLDLRDLETPVELCEAGAGLSASKFSRGSK